MNKTGTQTTAAAGITFDELLLHNEEETERWHEFFRRHPEALDIRIDIAQSEDVRAMLVHIMAVDLLYTERIQGITRANVSLSDFPSGSVDELFSTGAKARAAFRELLARYSEAEWNEVVEFGTKTSGMLRGSRRKMFAHTMFHSMRHWAQLATALRQHGLKQDWQHDFIFTKVID
jgi:uncharacterized damage-inducible protein DinB